MTDEQIKKIVNACGTAISAVLTVADAVTPSEAATEAEGEAKAETVEETAEAAAEAETERTPHEIDEELTEAEATDIEARIREALAILAEREKAKKGE